MTVLALGAGGMAEGWPDVTLVPHDECDVRDIHEVEWVLGRYKPEVIIVTAGISNPGPVGIGEPALMEIETNLIGAFNVADAAVRRLPPATLIFIASVAGLYGKPNHAAYCASKAGVISLVQSLAMEGHQAFAVSPGRVDTPMRERDYPQDTPGSRLEPLEVWQVIGNILSLHYHSGDNILIRKHGLTHVEIEVVPVPWRDALRVGQPVTI